MCLVGSRVLRMRNGDGKNKSVVVLGLISNNVLAGRGRGGVEVGVAHSLTATQKS